MSKAIREILKKLSSDSKKAYLKRLRSKAYKNEFISKISGQ